MRIAIISPYSFDAAGGVQSHILDLAQALIDRGHCVRVLGPGRANPQLPAFVHLVGRSLAISYNGSIARIAFHPAALWRVHRFLRDFDADLIHVHEPNAPSTSLFALLLARQPVVATYHVSAQRSRLLTVAKPLLRPILRRISADIAVSSMAQRWQKTQLGNHPPIIPNGVNTQLFRGESYRRRQRCPEACEAVFIGRLDEPRKGFDVLVRAVEHLDPTIHVTVIGAGSGVEHPRFNYVGEVSDQRKAEILGAADIFIAPHVGGESFGIVLVEAMAAGCAVVASDLEAFRHVLGQGVFVEPGNAAELARALNELAKDRRRRRQLAHLASRRAQDFDWSEIVPRILRIYKKVLDE